MFGGNGEVEAFGFLNITIGLQNVITYIGIDADNPSFVVYQWAHAGFGFERTLINATGMANVHDVIPFPRTPRSAAF